MKPFIKLLRPRQWIKNAFVLAPLIFSVSFTHAKLVDEAIAATLLFCAASSAGYVFNDIRDREADARHPVKSRTRPIAAGEITVSQAWIVEAALIAVLALGFLWNPMAAGIAMVYLAFSTWYTLQLKHIPVVDIFALACCFVLRIIGGCAAIGVLPSSWMMITTLSLALYLAAVKRRAELLAVPEGDGRRVLKAYTLPLLNRYVEMSALCAVMFYAIFTLTVRPGLAPTVPIVLFGVFRYWYISESTAVGESPTDALWGDWQLMLTVFAWAALCAVMLLRHH